MVFVAVLLVFKCILIPGFINIKQQSNQHPLLVSRVVVYYLRHIEIVDSDALTKKDITLCYVFETALAKRWRDG